MRYYPTLLSVRIGFLLVGLAILALAVPQAVWWWVAATGGFVFGAVIDMIMLPGSGALGITRKVDPEVGVGFPFELQLELSNRTRRPIRGIFWESWPAALASRYAGIPFRLSPGARDSTAQVCTLSERGVHDFGAGSIEYHSRLRLVSLLVRLSDRTAVTAIPGMEVMRSNAWLLRSFREAQAGMIRARGVGRGGEFESLAPYVAGDPPTAVDWKAYARSGTLAVRRFEPERRRHVMLCCDAGRLMGARIDGRRKVDHALHALTRLAAAALRRGDLVGLMIFDAEVLSLVPCRGGAGQLNEIVRASLQVASSHRETAFTPAFVTLNHTLGRRALVVLATDFDNTAQGWELGRTIALLRRRHAVVVCTLRDPAYLQAIRAEINSSEEAYRQLASLTLLEERNATLGAIQQGGVHAIDAEPEALSEPLLRLYGRMIAAQTV